MGTRNKLMRKKGVRKVSIRKKKQDTSKLNKAPLPEELRKGCRDIEARMNGYQTEWKKDDTLLENYKRNGLVLDPNAVVSGKALGRQQHMTKVVEEAQWVSAQLIKDGKLKASYEDDDETRAVENKVRHTGKREPKRLTTTQRAVIGKLMEKHGEDCDAMAKDIKLNKMQHTAAYLRDMIESLKFWGADGENTKHDFRAPHKPAMRPSRMK